MSEIMEGLAIGGVLVAGLGAISVAVAALCYVFGVAPETFFEGCATFTTAVCLLRVFIAIRYRGSR